MSPDQDASRTEDDPNLFEVIREQPLLYVVSLRINHPTMPPEQMSSRLRLLPGRRNIGDQIASADLKRMAELGVTFGVEVFPDLRS